MTVPVLWLLTPVARISGAVPVLGLLDEFTIILISMALFTSLSSRYLLKMHRSTYGHSAANSATAPVEVIEGEYYVIDRATKPADKKPGTGRRQ